MEIPPEPLALSTRSALIPFQWKPQALTAPVLDPEFPQMDGLQRAGEVLRYSIGKLEFWISPGGRLREWLRLNVTVAIFIGIPALLIAPLITFVLGQISTWTADLNQIATLVPITVFTAVAFTGAVLLMRLLTPR